MKLHRETKFKDGEQWQARTTDLCNTKTLSYEEEIQKYTIIVLQFCQQLAVSIIAIFTTKFYYKIKPWCIIYMPRSLSFGND